MLWALRQQADGVKSQPSTSATIIPQLLRVLQFCKKDSQWRRKCDLLWQYNRMPEKDFALPTLEEFFLCQCFKMEVVFMLSFTDSSVTEAAFASPDDWQVFTEVSPQKLHTCLCHEVSAVPLDGQHHMPDLHVTSKQHCQQGSFWSLHLTFL